MSTSFRGLGLLAIGSLLSVVMYACGGDSNAAVDMGLVVDLGEDTGVTDMGQDMGPPHVPTLFGPCSTAADCPGENAVCRPNTNGWPGGFCTVSCTPPDRSPCFDGNIYNHCLTQTDGSGSFCERRCQNGFDCVRSGYTCVSVGAFDQSGGVCIGVCNTDEQCGEGAVCNVWSGQCTTSVPTTGGVAGDTCTGAAACRSGNCIAEMNGATPTGWLDGYCYGSCILPHGYNTNTVFAGDALPQGTCPDTNVCFPTSFGYPAEGDPGICFQGCDSAADCRPGYECALSFTLGSGHTSTFTRGFCQPIDCSSQACPTGYSCRTVGSGASARHVCGV